MSAALLRFARSEFLYDRATGELHRRHDASGVFAGQRVGFETTGSRQAEVLGQRCQTAHIVWLLEAGALPNGRVAHLNGDPLDDRFENLALRGSAEHFASRMQKRFGEAHQVAAWRGMDQAAEFVCVKHGLFTRKPSRYIESLGGCPACSVEAAASVRQPVEGLRRSPDEKRAVRRAYVEANRGLYREASKRYHERRRHETAYRVGRICRSMLARVLAGAKAGGADRDGNTEQALGYTFEAFRQHIEARFDESMSWDNHGTWHVDHVRPVSWYTAHGIHDPRVINALANLRPLEANANIVKGARCTALSPHAGDVHGRITDGKCNTNIGSVVDPPGTAVGIRPRGPSRTSGA